MLLSDYIYLGMLIELNGISSGINLHKPGEEQMEEHDVQCEACLAKAVGVHDDQLNDNVVRWLHTA